MSASAAYESWHAALGVDLHANTPWHQLVREYLTISRDVTDKRLLEIGCGRGGFSCFLAHEAGGRCDIVAADFSPTAVHKGAEFARENAVKGVTWEVGDIENIAHHDASFDTVISCETIEHVPDPARAVRELGRVLKPGGRLFLSTPNYLSSTGLYRGYLRLRGRRFQEEGQPINNFNMLPRTMAWVRKAGLRVDHVSGTGHYLQVPGRDPVRIRALDGARSLTRWLALHSIVVATK